MPVLELEATVKASPDLVWQIIADMGGLAAAAEHVERVELSGDETGPGLKRRVYDTAGRYWDEECVDWQEGRSLTMQVDTSGYPVRLSSLRYIWSLQQSDNGVRLQMRYDYRVGFGPFGTLLDRWQFQPKLRHVCQGLLDSWVQMVLAREWAWRITVESILADKGRSVISVTPSASVAEVAHILRRERIGCVLVVDGENRLAGIASERDVVGALADNGAEGLQSKVSEIMSTNVITTGPADTMASVMRTMNERRIRHLPVIEKSALVGMISIGDVVKARIAELEGESNQLRDFIETRRFNELYRKIGPTAYAEAGHS